MRTLLLSFLSALATPVVAATLLVGPDERYKLPSAAAAAAGDGDTVEIRAGTYSGDAAVWLSNNLTIRGTNGRPHITSAGATAEGKAIWVIKGENVTIDNVELSGATVPDGNGAGIRHEGSGLRIVNSYVHDNEVGILTSNDPDSSVVIENSEFFHSFRRSGEVSHNIYIGQIGSFTLRFSYVHGAEVGHNVKSRARQNFILYNRIMDEAEGSSSYAVDIPWGGTTFLIGNVIQQGVRTENRAVIAYAAEGPENNRQELFVASNTIVSDISPSVFIRIFGELSQSMLVNNIFAGSGTIQGVAVSSDANLISNRIVFTDRERFDYHVGDDALVIDAGVEPGTIEGFSLNPAYEYVHPSQSRARESVGLALDLGAFETRAD